MKTKKNNKGEDKEIHKVCLEGNMKRFNELIKENNFKVNLRGKFMFTPLMCAAHSGNLKIVNKLLKINKVKINARSANRKTALIIASTKGNTTIVKNLIAHGAKSHFKQFDRSTKPCKPKSALNVSKMCGHNNIGSILNKKSKKKN